MTDNSAEGAFWSGPAGAKWIEHEAEQDHFLSGIAAAVVREELHHGEPGVLGAERKTLQRAFDRVEGGV